jgi:hypothetical protein
VVAEARQRRFGGGLAGENAPGAGGRVDDGLDAAAGARALDNQPGRRAGGSERADCREPEPARADIVCCAVAFDREIALAVGDRAIADGPNRT